MYQFTSSLHIPDPVQWQHDWNHAKSVARLLTKAYDLIRRGHGDAEDIRKAQYLVSRLHTSRKMSLRQRVRLNYVTGLGYMADGRYHDAAAWFGRGILLAARMGDLREQMELFDLRMTCHRALLEFDEAAADVHDCLRILDLEQDVTKTDDPHARLYLYSMLTTYELYRARPQETIAALNTARALARIVKNGQFEAATAEWVQAHLYLYQGEPHNAFHHAYGIREFYAQSASQISLDRFETFLAQAALRWAESLSPGSYRNHIIELAGEHLHDAERLARATQDLNGFGVIQLIRAQQSRLTQLPMGRIQAIARVLDDGDILQDIALTAQSYTALGDEFMARHEYGSARTCYSDAIASVERSQVRVLAVPARRGLSMVDEFQLTH